MSLQSIELRESLQGSVSGMSDVSDASRRSVLRPDFVFIQDLPEGDEDWEESLLRKHLFKKLKEHQAHHKSDQDIYELMRYQSLDYEVVENKLYVKKKRNQTSRTRVKTDIIRWLITLGIGAGTGLVAFILFVAVTYLSELRWNYAQSYITDGYVGYGYLYFAGLSIVYVGFSGAITAFIEPTAAGSGIPEVKTYLNGVALENVLLVRTLIVKVVGVAFAVAGGLAIGKEGPLVHTGSVIGICLCQLYSEFHWDDIKRDFVSCGAAAGVSAAFGAPSGSVLFVLEEAASYWSAPLLWIVIFSGFMATLILNIGISGYNGNILNIDAPGLITYGGFESAPFLLWEVPIFVVISVFGGLIGALFNLFNERLTMWRKKHTKGRKYRRWVETMIIALITATLCYWAPYFVGDCLPVDTEQSDIKFKRYQCDSGDYNQLATLSFNTMEQTIKNFFHTKADFGSYPLITYGCILWFCACITYGISVPSGLFVPCILTGCSYGRMIGELLREKYPNIVPGTYALVGAASFLGGATRMTISLTIIMLEVTNNSQYLLPLLITLLISKLIGDIFNISLYDIHIEIKNAPFVEHSPPKHLEQLTAGDVCVHPVVKFNEIENAFVVYQTLKKVKHNGFPILSQTNRLVGIMIRNQLIILLRHRVFCEKEVPNPPKLEDFSPNFQSLPRKLDEAQLTPEEIQDLEDYTIDMRPYMNPMPFSVHEDAPLTRIFKLYRSMGIKYLMVTNHDNELVGILTRKELMTDFRRDLC